MHSTNKLLTYIKKIIQRSMVFPNWEPGQNKYRELYPYFLNYNVDDLKITTRCGIIVWPGIIL